MGSKIRFLCFLTYFWTYFYQGAKPRSCLPGILSDLMVFSVLRLLSKLKSLPLLEADTEQFP